MSEQPVAAGWYPAPHAKGEMQYWDGSSWVSATDASAPTPSARQGFFSKKTTRATASLVAGSLFVVGVLLGAGPGSAARVDTAERTSALAVASATPTPDAAALAEQGRLEDEHDEALARVADLEAQLADTSTQLATARADLDVRQGELGSAQARIAELESAAAVTPAPQQPAPQQQAPQKPAPPQQSGAFKNCDAARAAGAAPVHRGDPGYAPHLDRDNDGIGCE